jgi:hypothetical protein
MEGRPNAYQSRISAVKRCFLGLRGAEHDFAELKPLRQKEAWFQVAVAFANWTESS